VIEAAGGLVWRINAKGNLKVLLVHRPRYDDWTLPKGKREPGESDLQAALREVAEETGLSCAGCQPLGETRYRDRKGRLKRVRYWAMEPLHGSFAPNHEVDEVRWVRFEDAAGVLSYDHDARLISALSSLALRPPTAASS
jgi:8-oxo-dGTP diphosphatase